MTLQELFGELQQALDDKQAREQEAAEVSAVAEADVERAKQVYDAAVDDAKGRMQAASAAYAAALKKARDLQADFRDRTEGLLAPSSGRVRIAE